LTPFQPGASFAPTMSSASDTTGPSPSPRAPSVFISYASEDRAAARVLRDTLTTAGLEVWYDEEELTGGDAWDQKIRRQIRDCDYFMPVISATTEARKEGYFRREWRLATDRSLDMADDVLFLLPVSIDGTAENGARVPDKFLAVQWLRAPNGNPTPALHHLIRRLLAGDHHVQTRGPTGATRPPMAYQKTTAPFAQPLPPEPPVIEPPSVDAAGNAPPPPPSMPIFPHPPEKGGFFHGIRFIAEVLWWVLTVAWLLFRRLPKWGRVVVTVWLVITLFPTRCNISNDPSPSRGDTHSAETKQAIKAVADEIAQAARDARKSRNPVDLARLGNDIARNFGPGGPGGPESAAIGKKLVLVPFARIASENPADKFASAVFASLYGRLTLTHGREVGLLRQSPPDAGDDALTARGKQLGSGFILAGRPAEDGQPPALSVRLLAVSDGSVKWTESFPVEGSEPTAVADQIAEHVLGFLPKR
jgi:hypothetical protein